MNFYCHPSIHPPHLLSACCLTGLSVKSSMKPSTTSLTRVTHFLCVFPWHFIHTSLVCIAMMHHSPLLLCRLMMLLLEGDLSYSARPGSGALWMSMDVKWIMNANRGINVNLGTLNVQTLRGFVVQGLGSESWLPWFLTLALKFSSSVALDKVRDYSVPQLPHLKTGKNHSTHPMRSLWGLDKII